MSRARQLKNVSPAPTPTEDQPQIVYMSARQLAARWSVEVATVWRWAQKGKIPKSVKLSGGTTRWIKHEIEAHEARLNKRA